MKLGIKQRGFTLLELMIVVTIISMLMGLAIYKTVGNVEYARRTNAMRRLSGLHTGELS